MFGSVYRVLDIWIDHLAHRDDLRLLINVYVVCKLGISFGCHWAYKIFQSPFHLLPSGDLGVGGTMCMCPQNKTQVELVMFYSGSGWTQDPCHFSAPSSPRWSKVSPS